MLKVKHSNNKSSGASFYRCLLMESSGVFAVPTARASKVTASV